MDIHEKGKKEKSLIAMTSVIAAVFLTGIKVVIGMMTGSLGILSEAAHSGLDLIAALITFFAVKVADKPPDKDHQFGHGKVENFSALAETILLLITCIWIISEAVDRLFFKTVLVEINFWSYLVVVVSIIIDFSRSRALDRVAKKYHSQALEADALHFKTDIWSSCVVLFGLGFAQFNFHQADSIAGVMVAGIVIWISFSLGKRTIDALLDRVPKGIEEKIKMQVLKMPEVENISSLRIRQSGPKVFVDLVIKVKRTLPFEKVHKILDGIEEEISKIIPFVDVTIHPEPVASSDESPDDKIMLITSKYDVGVHEIEKHILNNEKISVDLHIETNPDISFKEAHEISTKIEKDILSEISSINKVIIHIEEKAVPEPDEVEITNKSSELITDIESLSLEDINIRGCQNIIVFQCKNKYKVSMDCRISEKLKIQEVHKIITGIENKIKNKYPNIEKVTIHPEPI
jgi:cation diffusion facilitator family transporter